MDISSQSGLARPTASSPALPEQAIDLTEALIDPRWALRVPAALALRRKLLPCCRLEGRVLVACASLEDHAGLEAVERYIKEPIHPIVVDLNSLDRAIRSIFGSSARSAAGGQATRGGDGKPVASEDDAVALCDELLRAAVMRNASDVHIDPGPERVRVRLRVDGALEDYRHLQRETLAPLVSRIKVLAGMDIAERRAPQDGRMSWTSPQSTEIDIRTASLPTRFGEAITLRLLATRTEELSLQKLGMAPGDLELFSNAIAKPHGLILLTGPTGSGKSTTLYAGIRALIEAEPLHVVTVEDPIEYEMDNIVQVEADSADKVSFSKALRSILRHDPDVIMIGEIRDLETADTAIKSSLTGHLVLSTLHTNSALNAVTRLIDMGVAPYLVGATLRLVVAQRLVRRLCPRCREPRPLTQPEAIALGAPEAAGRNGFVPKGCVYCAGRGLVGRLALFEMLAIDQGLSSAIAAGKPEGELAELAQESGCRRLIHDALEKVLAGQTTVREALSAVTIW